MRQVFGVLAGILSGLVFTTASIAQKRAMNAIGTDKPLFRHLVRSPLWLAGFAASFAVGAPLNMASYMAIGPTLPPALGAISLAAVPLLARGFLGDRPPARSYAGAAAVALAVALIGLSGLSIAPEAVDWLDQSFLLRAAIAVSCIAAVATVCAGLGLRSRSAGGAFFALSAGVTQALMNAFMAPIAGQLGLVVSGSFGAAGMVIAGAMSAAQRRRRRGHSPAATAHPGHTHRPACMAISRQPWRGPRGRPPGNRIIAPPCRVVRPRFRQEGYQKQGALHRCLHGSHLAVTASSGSIWTSTDYGSTWNDRNNATGSQRWNSIASNGDGTRLTAVNWNLYSDGGNVWTSVDSGAIWTARSTAGSRNWVATASSSNGDRLAAAEYTGNIWTSKDAGETWTKRFVHGTQNWRNIAASSDGRRIAAISDEYIWTGVLPP